MRQLRKLFDALDLPRQVEVDIFHRVGPYNKYRTRPILIIFYGLSDRNLVYENRTILSKTKEFARIWINEDLGQVAKRTRNVVRQVAKQAKRAGREISATKYAVYIDKVKYDETNFDELPDDVSMESIKMQRHGNSLYYQSEYAPLSSFYYAPFTMDDIDFTTSEQTLMYTKARHHKERKIAKKILASRPGADTGFRKGGVLLSTKACSFRAHARAIFSPLYEVWGS